MAGATGGDLPPMGVLQRALSRHDTGLLAIDSNTSQTSFDNKRVLPHVRHNVIHEHVTESSPQALASALEQSRIQPENEQLVDSSSKTAPFDDATTVCSSSADEATVDKTPVQESGDKVQQQEDEEEAPPQRGMPQARDASHDCGNLKEGANEGKPRWEPNMQLTLQEFNPDLVRYLAEGAMCQCFLAKSPPDSMRLKDEHGEAADKYGVVIKTPIEGGQESAENDLVVESLVLRELSHPNIIPILGGGTTSTGASFIVLEYLGGGTLRSRLDSCGGGLGVKPAVKYGQALASALAFMHDGAVPGMILMHRDLKPDNIGFTSAGVVKLMDFGLGKVIHRTLRSRSVMYNMTGETGSPRYMSPEVALSLPYNEKADVWSFTIILWEMVSGRLPFAGQNMAMYLERVCEGGERPLVTHSWPKDLKSVLASGWQGEPDKRNSFREIEAILMGLHRESEKPKKGLFGRG